MKKTNFSGRIAALAGICSMAASAASAELVTVNLFDSVNTNGEVMTVPNNYWPPPKTYRPAFDCQLTTSQ
jgi:hypothetical protein